MIRHNFTLTEYNNMLPWHFDVHQKLLYQRLKEEYDNIQNK